jgi:hypothetical protein
MYAWHVLYKANICNIVYAFGDVVNFYNGANKHLIWFDIVAYQSDYDIVT